MEGHVDIAKGLVDDTCRVGAWGRSDGQPDAGTTRLAVSPGAWEIDHMTMAISPHAQGIGPAQALIGRVGTQHEQL